MRRPTIPSSLLIAAVLVVLAYIVADPLLRVVAVPFVSINLPLGIAAMFLGIFTVAVRREAVPQLLGLLALENGVFFAGIAIVPSLPVIAELAAAIDVPVVALVRRAADATHTCPGRHHRCGAPGRLAGDVRQWNWHSYC